jgi:hypothetical protein
MAGSMLGVLKHIYIDEKGLINDRNQVKYFPCAREKLVLFLRRRMEV